MKLAALVGGVCAVCRVPPQRHPRCAVCEGALQLVRLCAYCHQWNLDHGVSWNARTLVAIDGDGTEGHIRHAMRPLRDAVKPTRRRGRPRSRRIDETVIPLLLNRRVRVVVERVDLMGRNRGTYERWEWPSRREIARRAGCSHAAVDRRHHDYMGAKSRDARASSTRRRPQIVK